tara:strand:- start:15 stop:329 length:315 start_codon:yes stop_codon:yes gene_type:complete
MAKRVRNNALRMKKSLQKALLKTNEERNKVKERHLKEQKEKEKQQKKLEEKARKKSLLDSLDKMSYNDLRKLASEAGVTIYQRKKEEIKQDLKDYYERLWSETH